MSISSDWPTGRQDRHDRPSEITERFPKKIKQSSELGRMAQLVVPTGSFSRKRDVDVNRLLASRSLETPESPPKNPNVLGAVAKKVRNKVA